MQTRNLPNRRIQPPAACTAIAVSWLLSLAANAAPETSTALVESGKKLINEAKCETCHVSKVGGDGSSMYSRRDRRVTTSAKLLAQVARCNSDLSLGLFPDDESAIAAYLNAAHYKFKD